ncbi:helicase-related protein [Microbacterium sp. ARD31]|uniref:helicase-related protein n=1 Tax=Microbacterium sp. ARD31 TaxID=2962576 RepID=UPI00288146A3|nr:helicase-related protein [Microbacterium sp. ARD31]MDT0180210.1 helicase-related protein [Microbacterium sp. ARD31]
MTNPPNRQYSVGMLYPSEATDATGSLEDSYPVTDADVQSGDVDEDGATGPVAEDWRPSSVALSFVSSIPHVHCQLTGGTYERVVDDGPPRWQRTDFSSGVLDLSSTAKMRQLSVGGIPVEVGSRWRQYGSAFLVTVHVRVLAKSTGDDRLDIPLTLFQAGLSVTPPEAGAFLEYDPARSFDVDSESAEIRLRYRDRKVYAVGHGMAADWEIVDGAVTRVFLEPVPSLVVVGIETTGFTPGAPESEALQLSRLAQIDTDTSGVAANLNAFVNAFEQWVGTQEGRVLTFGTESQVAARIVARSRAAVERMRQSIELLSSPSKKDLRAAFALGMAAMRLQMRQTAAHQVSIERPLPEPKWRPFQLGFILVALASTVDEHHEDRDLVDLIWFPTGGGKTEAYLGLSAIEIFRRRIADGPEGGGTAILTRYTLRLLTTQQFQRTAALVCAMELLRRGGPHADPRARLMSPFTIGLWVGNEVTPGTKSEAKDALSRLHNAARPEEANQFQVESCPWCRAALLPERKDTNRSRYGFEFSGNDLNIHCTNAECEFSSSLPVLVVDDEMYAEPPTILLATVDKFARIQFRPEAGRLLGLGTIFRPPSIVIQDELHLLSGPLGTTVAVFDAVIQLLLRHAGGVPKIIASTATIRASEDQVRGLYGRPVGLYPPAGLDDDRTFFSQPAKSGMGRLFIGLMPQSLSQASGVIAAASPLLEIPAILEHDPASGATRDSYWTAVMYHNSLRELGRTGTLVVDDINGRLETRAERLGLALRQVRADRVLELTSRRGPEELPNDLRELSRSADTSDQAVDVVLSSNMLSVGIDIPRLALMLMVGQPKTTAEYIQATSRVGRGSNSGIVTTLFRSNRARDRSHFESFRSYHEALYRSVEPTSVTPWSLSSRERSLAGALVALARNTIPALASNDSAGNLNLADLQMRSSLEALIADFVDAVTRSEPMEAADTGSAVWALLREWDRRASDARSAGLSLRYDRAKSEDESLLKRFGQGGEGFLVADSMRSVEPNVAVEVVEPREGVTSGTNQA